MPIPAPTLLPDRAARCPNDGAGLRCAHALDEDAALPDAAVPFYA